MRGTYTFSEAYRAPYPESDPKETVRFASRPLATCQKDILAALEDEEDLRGGVLGPAAPKFIELEIFFKVLGSAAEKQYYAARLEPENVGREPLRTQKTPGGPGAQGDLALLKKLILEEGGEGHHLNPVELSFVRDLKAHFEQLRRENEKLRARLGRELDHQTMLNNVSVKEAQVIRKLLDADERPGIPRIPRLRSNLGESGSGSAEIDDLIRLANEQISYFKSKGGRQ